MLLLLTYILCLLWSHSSKTNAEERKYDHLKKSRCNLEATKLQPVNLAEGSEPSLVEVQNVEGEVNTNVRVD